MHSFIKRLRQSGNSGGWLYAPSGMGLFFNALRACVFGILQLAQAGRACASLILREFEKSLD